MKTIVVYAVAYNLLRSGFYCIEKHTDVIKARGSTISNSTLQMLQQHSLIIIFTNILKSGINLPVYLNTSLAYGRTLQNNVTR